MGADIASRIAAAQAMTQAQSAPTPAAKTAASAPAEAPAETSAESETSGDTSDASSAEGSDASAGTVESTDSGEGEPTETLTHEERIEAASKALEKGDLKALAKALGVDAKLPDASLKAFRSISRRERKHAEKVSKDEKRLSDAQTAIESAKREIAEDSAKNSRLLRHVEGKYGWIPKAEQAWDEGDMVTFGKALERMAKGSSLATITQRLAGMKTGDAPVARAAAPDPELERIKARNVELERQAAEREKAQKEQGTAERRDARKADFGKALAKHPFLRNPDEPGKVDADALEEAFKAYEASWDGKAQRFTKSAKQVVDELHAKELRRLKRLGLAPAAAPPPASARPNPDKKVTPAKTRLPEPPKTGKNGKAPTPEETRAHRVAMARRMTEQQQRGFR